MSPVFKTLLIFHIISGIICLITGMIAVFAKKKKGRHTLFGEVYHGSFIIVFITAIAMSLIHWQESAYLFYVAIFSYALALFGYIARKIRWENWIGSHIGGMLGSYIGIVTATLVVNAADIYLINKMPVLWVWFLPTIIGTPMIFIVANRYNTKKRPNMS